MNTIIKITELCGKRHDNIMRDIKKTLEELNPLKFEGVDFGGTTLITKVKAALVITCQSVNA